MANIIVAEDQGPVYGLEGITDTLGKIPKVVKYGALGVVALVALNKFGVNVPFLGGRRATAMPGVAGLGYYGGGRRRRRRRRSRR